MMGKGNNIFGGTGDVMIGDYHNVTGGKNNVILGSMATEEKTVSKTYQTKYPSGTVEVPYTVTETEHL